MATVTINGAAPKRGGSRRADTRYAALLARKFADAAAHAGLCREFTSAAGCGGLSSPTVIHVDLGDAPYLMVRMLSGQLISDFAEQRDRLAEGLSAASIGLTQRAHGILRIDLNPADPLVSHVQQADPVASGLWPVQFGALESGAMLEEPLSDCGHLAGQGQTRSGKTRWTYGVLGQLVGARDVEIAGIDPTGKLLGPWSGHPQGSDRITADSSYAAMERTAAGLVDDMRERIKAIPRNRDALPLGREFPLRLVVLEEWSNALTLAAIEKNKAKGIDTDLGRWVQILLAESHKAGYRLLLLAQRFDASVVGSLNRDNISHRFSFRTASKDGLKMLHEHIDDETAEAQSTAAPSVALAQTPSVALQRMRAAHVASYEDYLRKIDAGNHGAVNTAA